MRDGLDVVGRHLQRRRLITRRRIRGTHFQRPLEERGGLVEPLIFFGDHAKIDVRRVVLRIALSAPPRTPRAPCRGCRWRSARTRTSRGRPADSGRARPPCRTPAPHPRDRAPRAARAPSARALQPTRRCAGCDRSAPAQYPPSPPANTPSPACRRSQDRCRLPLLDRLQQRNHRLACPCVNDSRPRAASPADYRAQDTDPRQLFRRFPELRRLVARDPQVEAHRRVLRFDLQRASDSSIASSKRPRRASTTARSERPARLRGCLMRKLRQATTAASSCPCC